MPHSPFGNEPRKVERYRAFWNRAPVTRPLVVFSFAGWFPFGEFRACRQWNGLDSLTPEMIRPEEFIQDHLDMLATGEQLDDDGIRGACPALVAIPWMSGIVGAKVRILPENAMGEERCLPWEEALAVRLHQENAWLCKYLEFADALVAAAGGRFPVSHSPEIGPTDLHALLRTATQSILDLTDEPEKSKELLWRLGEIFRDVIEAIWGRLPLWEGGYYDAQYCLWAPGPIIRMQEDATAVYSPALYREFVQPVDRMLARRFASSFIHLHSTSMFLLDAFLEIEEIQCFEINQDALGPPVTRMIPYFQKVQKAGKPLLIRGSFTPEELRLLTGLLDARGLFLHLMVDDMKQVELLRPIAGL